MPWSGQNGNNGGWKGSNDGPWGQSPKDGGNQPDIEQLFKKKSGQIKTRYAGWG